MSKIKKERAVRPADELLIRWYRDEKLGIDEIAVLCNSTPRAVYNWINRLGLHTVDGRRTSVRPSDAVLVDMRDNQGLSYEDIAGEYSVTKSTVRTWMSNARRRMKESMEK